MTAHGLWPSYVHRVRGRLASKVVSIAEGRFVDLADVRPGPVALDLSARTGKPAEIVELILGESSEHFVAGGSGPIIARHHLGHQLTSAGIDRAGANGAWLLPRDPDASARSLRDAITACTGAPVAVLRGIAYERSDDGVAAMLHKTP